MRLLCIIKKQKLKITQKLKTMKNVIQPVKNIFTEIKSTIVGIILIASAIWYDLGNVMTFVLLGIGIVLLFARDKIPMIVKRVLDKFVGKSKE